MSGGGETTVLWRPAGPRELDLIRESGWRRWPPISLDRLYFFPILSEDFAIGGARDWNSSGPGVRYVTRFRVETGFLRRYSTRVFGGSAAPMLWVPTKDMDEFNAHIVGLIEVVHEIR
ncbi:ADP-ribosylation/crystallin J1 [Micromonospora chalcea]|uniref:ADP-ribosylation/crystallin J1 n=1 Tax=Micromonospora chalcea TaxID=1874 RepID=UPI0021A51E05|nr:ADP-ribosylation/crystallin J1 [Micromonospora chalcea]MCT2279063.1 ADP-ribosylation/crystallin J1 [Micromonospora chalcea]